MRRLVPSSTRNLLFLFLASSLCLAAVPSLDLSVSRLFFDGSGFYLRNRWWVTWLQECVGYFIGLSLASVLAIFGVNRLSGSRLLGVDGKVVAYVFLSLLIGAGLIVNVLLKNSFGRARPRNVQEFCGDQKYSPAFVFSTACPTNSSFASGDAAGAFFALPLAYAFLRRRSLWLAAAAFGVLVSFSRVASGAHFFSDTVVSLFVMWIVADLLHAHLLRPAPHPVLLPDKSAPKVDTASPIAPAGLEPLPPASLSQL